MTAARRPRGPAKVGPLENLTLDTRGAPRVVGDEDVAVGDVYAITGGVGGPRYAVLVAISGETGYEMKFNSSGEVYGVGQSGLHYLRRRLKVGRVRALPTLDVEWFEEAVPPRCCSCC